MPALINSLDLAEMLGIPPRTLDQWAYRHTGPPYVKVGRHRRYDIAKVEAWLEENTVDVAS